MATATPHEDAAFEALCARIRQPWKVGGIGYGLGAEERIERDVVIHRITNAEAVDPSCYVRFAMMIGKPRPATAPSLG
jgi:hypothetical protein